MSELINAGRSRLTGRQYLYALGYFEGWLKAVGIDFQSVTREDIQQWLSEETLAGHEAATRRNRFAVVKSWYAWLTALDYVKKDPCLAILPIKVQRKLPVTLGTSEVDLLVKHCETARERAIIEALYSTLARRAGFLLIKLLDLDFAQGQVKITGKGGKEHYHQLTPRAIRAIQKWMKKRERYPCLKRTPTDYLWIGRNGPLKFTQLGGIIHAIRSRAGLNRKVTPHTFRHTGATLMKDKGVPLEDIQEVLDHANIQTTQIYAKTSTAHMKKAWNKLPRR